MPTRDIEESELTRTHESQMQRRTLGDEDGKKIPAEAVAAEQDGTLPKELAEEEQTAKRRKQFADDDIRYE